MVLKNKLKMRILRSSGAVRGRAAPTLPPILVSVFVLEGEDGVGPFDQVLRARLHADNHQPGGCEAPPKLTAENNKAAIRSSNARHIRSCHPRYGSEPGRDQARQVSSSNTLPIALLRSESADECTHGARTIFKTLPMSPSTTTIQFATISVLQTTKHLSSLFR